MNTFDKYAPIIPYKGLGGIKLYSTLNELKNILSLDNVHSYIINDCWIRYDVENCIELFFHAKNKKLFRLTTLDEYKGTLFGGIGVGSSEEEILKVEPSFKYDEFQEIWESEKGVFIETDASTNKARWISVYIRELDSDNFELARW